MQYLALFLGSLAFHCWNGRYRDVFEPLSQSDRWELDAYSDASVGIADDMVPYEAAIDV